MKRRKSKLNELAPIRLVGEEAVEIELQDTPQVRVSVKVINVEGRKLVEITGMDCALQIQPWTSNQIRVDSDNEW